MFIMFSVTPIANVETRTPIISASCCFHGVAPTRKPVFRSCEVSPAFGGGDADHAADGDGQRAKCRGRPTLHQEDRGGGHQGGDGHAGDRIRGAADETDDPR